MIGELGEVWWSVTWADMGGMNTRDWGFVLFIAVFFVLITIACIRRRG